MDVFLKLAPADQLDAYVEVNRAMGLDAASVEKDFWVCWTLRELFFRFSWVDYTTHKPGTFRLTPTPTPEHLGDWKSDYAAMLGPMFFGETPGFEDIITLAADFEAAFNASATSESSGESI